jgi:hypothetical protein
MESSWEQKGDDIDVSLSLPDGVSANIGIPG